MALNLDPGLTNDVVRNIARLISRLEETSKDRDSNQRQRREKAARTKERRRTEIKLGLETRAAGEKSRFREADDTVAGEEVGQGLRGEVDGAGGEKLEKNRKKEAQHKQSGLEGKGKEDSGGCGDEKVSLVRGRPRGPKAAGGRRSWQL